MSSMIPLGNGNDHAAVPRHGEFRPEPVIDEMKRPRRLARAASWARIGSTAVWNVLVAARRCRHARAMADGNHPDSKCRKPLMQASRNAFMSDPRLDEAVIVTTLSVDGRSNSFSSGFRRSAVSGGFERQVPASVGLLGLTWRVPRPILLRRCPCRARFSSITAAKQPISFLIETALQNPGLINLAAGLVDPLTLPLQECAEISRRIFSDTVRGRAALQYDTTQGLRPLRHRLLEHIAELEGTPAAELGYSTDQIVLTTGSQQALYLVCDALVDPGDIVIAANPSYFVYTGTLQSLDANVMCVPMDEDGMDVEAVAALLERLDREGKLSRVKLVYCTSYFDNPTGLSLSPGRRRQLLDIVRSYDNRQRILILEDAAYRELRYDGPAMRSMKSMDVEGHHTILSLTFSKPFAPGLKLGYSAMPDDLLHAVLQQKGNHDFGSSNLAQHIALEAMRDGSYGRHVELLIASYRKKRDAILAALTERFMPPDDTEASPGRIRMAGCMSG